MRSILLAAAAAALFLGAGQAQAQDRAACGPGLVCASNPDTILRAMTRAGLKPERIDDEDGDPMIGSTEASYPFRVYFYGCEGHKNCDSIRFEVAFRKEPDNTLALANKWNAGKRFLQAAVLPDGKLVVAYDVATIGGLTERNMADVLDWWKSQLGELGDFFQAELKPASAGQPKTK